MREIMDEVLEFQSTPPRRRRHVASISFLGVRSISIHASAKEATGLILHLTIIWKFQSTPPRRRRPDHGTKNDIRTYDFNPRLREGGDSKCGQSPCDDRDFNPRLREGGDSNLQSVPFASNISIHASAKEATIVSNKLMPKTFQFQSTPPRRRRLL